MGQAYGKPQVERSNVYSPGEFTDAQDCKSLEAPVERDEDAGPSHEEQLRVPRPPYLPAYNMDWLNTFNGSLNKMFSDAAEARGKDGPAPLVVLSAKGESLDVSQVKGLIRKAHSVVFSAENVQKYKVDGKMSPEAADAIADIQFLLHETRDRLPT